MKETALCKRDVYVNAIHTDGLATISRLPQNIGFFCKRAL